MHRNKNKVAALQTHFLDLKIATAAITRTTCVIQAEIVQVHRPGLCQTRKTICQKMPPLYGRETGDRCHLCVGSRLECVARKKNKAWMFFLVFFLAISTVCHTKLKGLKHKSSSFAGYNPTPRKQEMLEYLKIEMDETDVFARRERFERRTIKKILLF